MKANRDTDSLPGSTKDQLDLELERAVSFASEVKKQWRNGATPDATAILMDHPDLLRYRSLALDLAAEEYDCRQASGEAVSADEFAVRFPGMEKSLYFLLEVRRMMQQDSSLGNSPSEIIWPEPGDEFLGFSLLSELGQGTFGHVFLASEPSLGNRLVALKVAPQGQWEAEILGKLGHSNIVPVYSIQKDHQTGLTAVCMPYLGRVTLLDVIERVFADHKRPCSGSAILDLLKEFNENAETPTHGDFDVLLIRGSYIDAVVHLGIQLADALAFTHDQGIFHRDLKPSNILVSNNGHPLILDFNLSSDGKISPARIGGTLPYMAPEQLQVLLKECSPAVTPDPALSDLFSLGVILYELASGELPFGVPNMKGKWDDVALDLLVRQKKGPRPIQEINPDVDGRLATLITECLAMEPAHRPQSVKMLANSLRRQQGLYRRAKRWSRRHPLTMAGTGVFLMICGLLCGLWLALRDPYPIRLYKAGLVKLQQGDSSTAIGLFNEALTAVPDNRDILLERGKAYYLKGKYNLAFEDYQRAYSLNPTGEIAALLGHCMCRTAYYRPAILHYEKARAAGYKSASLFNNLGFCYMQLAKFSEADLCFQEAVSLEPHSAIAWHNIVRLTLKKYHAGEIPIPSAISIIKNALAADEPSSEMYFDIAVLESRIMKTDPAIISEIFEHLSRSIALGAEPRRISREIEFASLQDRQEFASLLRLTPGIRQASTTDGIMSPF